MNRKGYALWKGLFLANEKEIFYDPGPEESKGRLEILPETGTHTQAPSDLA